MAQWAGFAALLCLASVLVYGRVLSDIGHTVFAHNDDTSLFIFWFAHAADVTASWLGSGSGERNYLYTISMNYPTGVNGGWNTTMLGLGLPFVPVTWLFGPVVAYNLAILLSPVACALAAAFALHQFVPRFPAFVGGFAYGFSTYVIAQSAGHLNLAFAILPPLVLAFLSRLLVGRAAWWKNGLCLGAAVGWQFYLSTELLAHTFLATLVVVIIASLLAWPVFRAGLSRLLKGGSLAAGVAGLLGIPLLVVMLNHPGRPRAEIRPHGIWNTDLADPITPGIFTLLGSDEGLIERAISIDPSEIGGYFGIAWLALAFLTLIGCFFHPRFGTVVRVAGLAALVLFLFSMGSPWRLHGTTILDPGPFRFFETLPVFEHVLPMRIVVHVTLALALLMAIGLHVAQRSKSTLIRRGTVGLTILALLTVTSGTVTPRQTTIAEFYATGLYAEHIAPNAIVKMLPSPTASDQPYTNESLVNQAVTGMAFKQTGGYFIGATETQPVIYQAPKDSLDELLATHANGTLPDGHNLEVRDAIAELRAAGVNHIAITDGGMGLTQPAADIATMLATAAGVQYVFLGGVYLVTL